MRQKLDCASLYPGYALSVEPPGGLLTEIVLGVGPVAAPLARAFVPLVADLLPPVAPDSRIRRKHPRFRRTPVWALPHPRRAVWTLVRVRIAPGLAIVMA